jgi:SNF2 family DNA or RNA helicase
MIFSWKPRPDAEKQIYERLGNLCVSMKTADYLQLPERVEVRHEIETSEETLALYQKLEKDMLLPYDDGDIDAGSAAILVNKLLQVAGGAAYNENGETHVLHNEKLDALDTLIEEANGQPVLLFYAYRHERDRIKERHPEAVDVKDASAVKDWNAGNIPILLAHPASAGHGLNLQFGGHIVIWYGLPLSLELYQQANKRVHRMGQKETVLIHHLLMKNTADMWVLDQVLTTKTERQDALLEALKVRIKEVCSK